MELPWKNEPHKWDGEMMAMRRGPMGNWCGYVAVAPNHPLYGKDYSDQIVAPPEILEREINMDKVGAVNILCASGTDPREGIEVVLCFDVHGGLTYAADHCATEQPDGNWWFGFDCGHYGDLSPKMGNLFGDEATYRDFDYVKSEVLSLARQLARWKQPDAA